MSVTSSDDFLVLTVGTRAFGLASKPYLDTGIYIIYRNLGNVVCWSSCCPEATVNGRKRHQTLDEICVCFHSCAPTVWFDGHPLNVANSSTQMNRRSVVPFPQTSSFMSKPRKNNIAPRRSSVVRQHWSSWYLHTNQLKHMYWAS